MTEHEAATRVKHLHDGWLELTRAGWTERGSQEAAWRALRYAAGELIRELPPEPWAVHAAALVVTLEALFAQRVALERRLFRRWRRFNEAGVRSARVTFDRIVTDVVARVADEHRNCCNERVSVGRAVA